jgi:hypothetical protein
MRTVLPTRPNPAKTGPANEKRSSLEAQRIGHAPCKEVTGNLIFDHFNP